MNISMIEARSLTGPRTIVLGKDGVIRIEEFTPQKPGQLWHYNVYYEDGSIDRFFEPVFVHDVG